MRYTIVLQKVEYLSGIFRGKRTERYIRCYTEKEKLQYLSRAEVWGSPVKLISAEVLK